MSKPASLYRLRIYTLTTYIIISSLLVSLWWTFTYVFRECFAPEDKSRSLSTWITYSIELDVWTPFECHSPKLLISFSGARSNVWTDCLYMFISLFIHLILNVNLCEIKRLNWLQMFISLFGHVILNINSSWNPGANGSSWHSSIGRFFNLSQAQNLLDVISEINIKRAVL